MSVGLKGGGIHSEHDPLTDLFFTCSLYISGCCGGDGDPRGADGAAGPLPQPRH